MANMQLANVVANVIERDGAKIFTIGPAALVEVEVAMVDLVGRSRYMTVPDNTVMVIVPTGDHGALIFDPEHVKDPAGRPCMGQRTLVSRLEIGQMIDTALADHAKSIAIPKMGDVLRFGGN